MLNQWQIQGVVNRAKVSQCVGEKTFWPLPFKGEAVQKKIARTNATFFIDSPVLAPPLLIGWVCQCAQLPHNHIHQQMASRYSKNKMKNSSRVK